MAELGPDDLPSPWRPEEDPQNLKALGKLGEEAGELAKIVCRCIIQGIGEREPVTGEPNELTLEKEIADVLANIDVVVAHFGLNCEFIDARRSRKADYISRWVAMQSDGRRGMLDIVAERHRQIDIEGWTSDHDGAHDGGELLAAAYAYFEHALGIADLGDFGVPVRWPWDRSWWKPRTPRRDLVRAGALFMAERDRRRRRDGGAHPELSAAIRGVAAEIDRLDGAGAA